MRAPIRNSLKRRLHCLIKMLDKLSNSFSSRRETDGEMQDGRRDKVYFLHSGNIAIFPILTILLFVTIANLRV